MPRLAALGTSCPDHFLRTKVRPMVLHLPPTAPLEAVEARLRDLHAAYREDYRAYYERHAEADSRGIRQVRHGVHPTWRGLTGSWPTNAREAE